MLLFLTSRGVEREDAASGEWAKVARQIFLVLRVGSLNNHRRNGRIGGGLRRMGWFGAGQYGGVGPRPRGGGGGLQLRRNYFFRRFLVPVDQISSKLLISAEFRE